MARPSRWPLVMKVYVDNALWDALHALAIRDGNTVNDVCRRALTREVARNLPSTNTTRTTKMKGRTS